MLLCLLRLWLSYSGQGLDKFTRFHLTSIEIHARAPVSIRRHGVRCHEGTHRARPSGDGGPCAREGPAKPCPKPCPKPQGSDSKGPGQPAELSES